MIQNAKDVLLTANPGTLPNVQDALFDYFQLLTFTQVAKTVVNGQLIETNTSTSFMGARQPFTSQQLMMKPEKERAWKWEMIHATPELVLSPDDIIVFGTTPYRVMQKWNWAEYGYVQYEIEEDFTS